MICNIIKKCQGTLTSLYISQCRKLTDNITEALSNYCQYSMK